MVIDSCSLPLFKKSRLYWSSVPLFPGGLHVRLGFMLPLKSLKCVGVCVCVCMGVGVCLCEGLYFNEISFFAFQDDVFKILVAMQK